jgi:hypothetical protein
MRLQTEHVTHDRHGEDRASTPEQTEREADEPCECEREEKHRLTALRCIRGCP